MPLSQHFQQSGSGSPIVFVHGSYATTSTWKKLIEPLSKRHLCIAIKLPGHGGTPDPQDFAAPSVETELSLIEGIVRELTDEPIHLVGHSYGGVVALAQALKGSLPIRELTLFEPVATWVLSLMQDSYMQNLVSEFLQRYRPAAQANDPLACGQVIDFWSGEPVFAKLPQGVRDMMAPLTRNNLRHWDICQQVQHTQADLQALDIPTRLVCGTESNMVAHAIADHLASLLPQNNRYDIEDASHGMVTSHAEDCLFVLQDPIDLNQACQDLEDR